MKQTVGFKAELHKRKVKIAIEQALIVKRRLALWAKIAPLISHPHDRKIVGKVLAAKNITPRYW